MGRLIKIISGIFEGKTTQVEENRELQVGRGLHNDLILRTDIAASNKHASLRLNQGRLELYDHNSSNGSHQNRARLPSHHWLPVAEKFVLGSTVFFSRATHAMTKHAQPIPLDNPALAQWQTSSIFKYAEKVSQGSSQLNAAHLFLGLLNSEEGTMVPFLRALGLPKDMTYYREKVLNSIFFKSDDAWLNRFLKVQSEPHKAGIRQVTPFAARLLEIYFVEKDPITLLTQMIDGDFNLVHTLIDAKRATALKALEQCTNPPVEQTIQAQNTDHKNTLIYTGFWNQIIQIINNGKTPLIFGSRGIGKSFCMQLAVQGQMDHVLPPFLGSPIKKILDARTYLLFNPPKTAGRFIRQIGEEVAEDGLVILDHVGQLIQVIEKHRADPQILFKAVNKRKTPNLILVTDKAYKDQLDENIPGLQPLDMDAYMSKYLDEVHVALLDQFEVEIGGILGSQAKDFFFAKVVTAKPADLRHLKEFLDLCLRRAHQVHVSGADTNVETRSMARLGESCFAEVFKDWGQPSVQAPDSKKETEVLKRLERLIELFSTSLVKVKFRYGPDNGSFDSEGRWSRDEKLDHLPQHLTLMLRALKAGFRNWYNEYLVKQISPAALREKHGKRVGPLWKAYEQYFAKRSVDLAENEMREACFKAWDKESHH